MGSVSLMKMSPLTAVVQRPHYETGRNGRT